MKTKRAQLTQTAEKAKKGKMNFFNRLNLPSTSASTTRALGKQDSEPHGGQPAIDSQDSDNVPMSVCCLTVAQTLAADDQPLAEPTAVIEVVEPDTDKESHIVMQDVLDAIGDTQIDMDETKAEEKPKVEDKPTDETKAEEKPMDETKADDLPDGYTTPPRAELRSLIASVDDIDSDPEACSKYFQNISGTHVSGTQKWDKHSADSLEASFDKLAGQFADLGTDKAEQSDVPPPIAKKMAELNKVVKSNTLDPHSSLAQAFRREHAKDPAFTTMGRVAQQNYKVEWAKKNLTALNVQHTKTESFSRVDTTKGTYKNFGQLVVSQGGICMGGPKNMGPQYGDRVTSYKNTYTPIYIYIYLYISLL